MIDEGVSCGKGANAVISMVHHFLEEYGIGEQHLHLHADNCAGQNKNNSFLWYLCWRTMVGLHTSISFNFMLTGHTKFAPDWCFGLLKRQFRRTKVSCLEDIVEVVKASTVKGTNVPQLCGNEQGEVYVKTYDWAAFLDDKFRRFPGIKSFQHYRFTSEKPGVVLYRAEKDTEEKEYDLCRVPPCVEQMPPVLKPKGLDKARREYLYKEIREFCTPEAADIVCPDPQTHVAAPSASRGRKRGRVE